MRQSVHTPFQGVHITQARTGRLEGPEMRLGREEEGPDQKGLESHMKNLDFTLRVIETHWNSLSKRMT